MMQASNGETTWYEGDLKLRFQVNLVASPE